MLRLAVYQTISKRPLGGASFVEMRIKQADLNTDKLFLDFDILKENIGIAARGLSRGEAACYRIKY